MLGHFGFSYVGLIYLLALWIPNGMWAKNMPQGYSSAGENKVLLAFERAGQILCTGAILLFSDYNPSRIEISTLWFTASVLLMVLYELFWIRYFRSAKTARDFYRPFLGVPCPGATLPVVAFLLLGIYGKVIWLMIASIILGVGHIGIHTQHSRQIINSQGETST